MLHSHVKLPHVQVEIWTEYYPPGLRLVGKTALDVFEVLVDGCLIEILLNVLESSLPGKMLLRSYDGYYTARL